MPDYITIAHVREELLDRTAEDHMVLADLAFTDEDISAGMRGCVRKFNRIKPFVATHLTEETIPYNTTLFFDGITCWLLKRWLLNVSLNDYKYEAGGVTADVQGSLRRNLEKLVKELEAEFVSAATDMKLFINLNDAFGPVG